MTRFIPLGKPDLGPAEEQAVLNVMRSGMLVQGKEVAAFEAALCDASGRTHALAVTNGTAALSLGLEVLGVGPGDEVIVPAMTWPSPAHAVHKLGARAVLVDIDDDEWNPSPEAYASAKGARTKAAIIIDQFGNPARADEIARALGDIPIVEDAACAIGSRFATGRPCGSAGVMSCFSFHPRKVLTTGEGGAITTDDDELAERLTRLRNHGQTSPGTFAEAGLNHRMSDLAGAIGRVQMERLDAMLDARLTHAKALMEALPDLRFQTVPEGARSNRQTLGARLPDGIVPSNFIARMGEQKVQVGRLSYNLGSLGTVGPHSDFPHTHKLLGEAIALPLFPQMNEGDITQVVDAIYKALG